MAFTALRTWVAGEIVTAAMLNEQVRDNGNEYIQRDGSIPLTTNWDAGSYEIRAQTLESDATTGTAPLTIASTTLVTNLNADQVDSQERVLTINADHTHQTTGAQGGQLDHGAALTGLSDDDHTQYVLRNILTTRGDLFRRGASVVERVALGTNGYYLKSNGTDAVWAEGVATKDIFIRPASGTDAQAVGYFYGYLIDFASEYAYFNFYVPQDFSSLTGLYLVYISQAEQAHYFDVDSQFGADGEAYNVHTDIQADLFGASIVVGNIDELDISSAVTGIAANDFVGLRIQRGTSSTCQALVIGVRLRYS
uniref:Uncharacterized protein n=1 Tax=viral metagenome TaxID=1070528 RepID=A0A6M3KHB6_9ZZZZ